MEAGTAEVAESEFRTQPVATAVSATGGVDTTPTCTRADAHFSRAHITVHSSLIRTFPTWAHRIGSRYKESVSRIYFSALIFNSLLCPCCIVLLVASFLLLPLLRVLCQDPQRHRPRWRDVE